MVVLLLAFNALLVWVATGPRSLTMLTPYVESAFSDAQSNYKVKIGETVLLWDGWRHPVDIRLRDVQVLTRDGVLFSSFPDIALGIDVLSLPLGRILPTSLTINSPVISLLQNEDRSISFGFGERKPEAQAKAEAKSEEIAEAKTPEGETPEATPEQVAVPAATMPFAALIAPLLETDSGGSLRKLNAVHVKQASISLGSLQKGVILDSDDTDISLQKDDEGKVHIIATSTVQYGKVRSPIKAGFVLGKELPTIDASLEFIDLHLADIMPLLPVAAPVELSTPLSGHVRLSFDREGAVQGGEFLLDMGKGTLKAEQLAGELPITSAHLEGLLGNAGADITIKALTANIDGMPLSGSGSVKGLNAQIALDASVAIEKVPAGKVALFWPPSLAPITREWVVGSITDGMVEKATAVLKMAPGDLDKPTLPKESVDANVKLSGAKIRYVPEHPALHAVNADVHIDGLMLDATIHSASFMSESKITDAKVLIEDLNPDNPYIKVSGDMSTSASEAMKILGLPRIDQAQRLALVPEKAAGRAKGKIALGFYFFERKDKYGRSLADEDLDYTINAQLEDVSQPAFLSRFELRGITGALDVDKKHVQFKGKGTVNGATLIESDVRYLYTPEKGFDTFIEATGGMPIESLPRFGVGALSFLENHFGFKANIKQGPELQLYDASLNLTETGINYPKYMLIKPAKTQAKLNLTASKRGEEIDVSKFELSGKDMSAKGSAILAGNGEFKKLLLEKTVFGKTDLDSLHYEEVAGGFSLLAKGASADMTGWLADDSGEGFSFKNFPAMTLNVDVARVITREDTELAGVKGEASCTVALCQSVNIAGKTMPGDQPFNFRIMRNPKQQRQLSLHAADAGAFLRALDILDGMQGGDLSITGNYDDSGAQSVLRGKADITAYTIKGAPILAKILSLASLQGFIDTMQGKGIGFKRLSAPFTLANDIITVDKGKTFGEAMGITADGTITMPGAVMNLSGTVVPSYSLNTAVGKVPVLGSLLTGGEGQGVFAARYDVKGTEKESDVSVNPLSMLTPGFLRGLFDVFDGESTEAEKPAEAPAAPPAQEEKPDLSQPN